MQSKPQENKDRLSSLKQRILTQHDEITLADEQFLLAKELGCLGEIIGREYELIKVDGEVVGFRQKPMPIPTYIKLMKAFEKFKKIEEREMKKSKRKGGKR